MGYGKQRAFDQNKLWYEGILKNGTRGSSADASAFKDGGVSNAYHNSELVVPGSESMIGGIDFGSWGGENGISNALFGGSKTGPNGVTPKTGGVVGPAISAFNAYTNWDQGNKMYDLAEDKFDFAQDSFWTKYATDKDLVNRQINATNHQIAYNNAARGMNSLEQKNAWLDNKGVSHLGGGNITEADGSVNTGSGMQLDQKYQAQPVTPAATNTTAPSQPVSAAKPVQSGFVKAAPKPVTKKIA